MVVVTPSILTFYMHGHRCSYLDVVHIGASLLFNLKLELVLEPFLNVYELEPKKLSTKPLPQTSNGSPTIFMCNSYKVRNAHNNCHMIMIITPKLHLCKGDGTSCNGGQRLASL